MLLRRSADWQSAVSQVGNLRLGVSSLGLHSSWNHGVVLADCQSAIQQVNNLRYNLRWNSE
jgi:hypothetical protein